MIFLQENLSIPQKTNKVLQLNNTQIIHNYDINNFKYGTKCTKILRVLFCILIVKIFFSFFFAFITLSNPPPPYLKMPMQSKYSMVIIGVHKKFYFELIINFFNHEIYYKIPGSCIWIASNKVPGFLIILFLALIPENNRK